MADPIENSRRAGYPVDQLFLDRWSPRGFTGEAIAPETLMSFFEAARWAPSASNLQPWCFLWARRDTAPWPTFFDLLGERNKLWAAGAAALVVVTSKTTMVRSGQSEPVASHSHSYDTGAAWENFALQATLSGWHVHGMVGFDMERARAALRVPEDYRIEAAIAVGRRGAALHLPENMQKGERPNARKPVAEITHEGGFPVPV